jgi:hypothetical protein
MTPSHHLESVWLEREARTAQIPVPSLLLAAVLSGSLWWGILAGVRLIWRVIS